MSALRKSMTVNFDDYGVVASPLADFTREMERRGMADRIVECPRGVGLKEPFAGRPAALKRADTC